MRPLSPKIALSLMLGFSLLSCGLPARASRVIVPKSGLVTSFDSSTATVGIDGTVHPISPTAVVHMPDGSVKSIESAAVPTDSKVGYTVDHQDRTTVTGLWIRDSGEQGSSGQ